MYHQMDNFLCQLYIYTPTFSQCYDLRYIMAMNIHHLSLVVQQ